ncbi:MAG: hypothetical protein FJ030_11520 [Chloroflexi bacterium]|nr:hypothetical protein [Chloroflexota bacterium]
MNEIAQGAIVSALGLSITFAALTFIIAVISLLTRLFQPKPEAEASAEAEPIAATIEEASVSEEEEVAAAIAVALRLIRSANDRQQLGAALESGRGAWWQSNRARPVIRRKS